MAGSITYVWWIEMMEWADIINIPREADRIEDFLTHCDTFLLKMTGLKVKYGDARYKHHV